MLNRPSWTLPPRGSTRTPLCARAGRPILHIDSDPAVVPAYLVRPDERVAHAARRNWIGDDVVYPRLDVHLAHLAPCVGPLIPAGRLSLRPSPTPDRPIPTLSHHGSDPLLLRSNQPREPKTL